MQRPTSVTVFGILNIVFAAIGVFGLIASIALFFLPANLNNPVIKIMHENPAYATWLKVCIPLGLLSCAALLAAGIGLLRLKSWARTLSIAYAIYAIVFGILGTVVNFFFIVRPILEQARQQHGPEAAGAIGGAIGGSIGGCLGLIYPVLLLIFMLRPTVVAAFRPSAPPQT
jgi:tellurite resistance protein TehA-like permease